MVEQLTLDIGVLGLIPGFCRQPLMGLITYTKHLTLVD